MQWVSSRIWTRVAVFISFDDNNYTTGNCFLWMMLKKIFFCDQVDNGFFACGIRVSLGEVVYRSIDVIRYFLYKVPNYFGVDIKVYFWGKGSPRGSSGFFDGTSKFGSLMCIFVLIFWSGACFKFPERCLTFSNVFGLLRNHGCILRRLSFAG